MRIDTGKPNDAFEEDDSDPIEELLLVAYPNPERVGCPDASVIDDLGNKRIEQGDPTWNHIWHCSPCFAEYKRIRDARWAAEAAKTDCLRRLRFVGALAATCVLLGALWAFLKVNKNHHQLAPAATGPELLATIDLFDTGVLRGGESHEVHLPPLSKRATGLLIILPRFSEPGHYAVAVLRSRDSDKALAKSAGTAVGGGERFELRIPIDLANVPTGNYLLATKRDANSAVYYYPLAIVE